MSNVKNLVKPVVKEIYRQTALLKLSKLRKIKNPTADMIAEAISDSLKNNLNLEEREWVEKIEQKRKSLNNSTRQISINDFGAGDPNHSRNEEEMNQGVFINSTVGEICQIASKPYFWSLLLFKLIRELKPLTSIELGTCLGISGAYQAAAKKLNGKGKLITMEGAESLANLSIENFRELGLENIRVISGKFQDNLDAALKENKPIDYAFIDGHHDENATISYFQQFLPYLAENSIMVFDDISWSAGMRRAWETISDDDNVKIALDLRAIGICVFDNNLSEKYKLKISLL